VLLKALSAPPAAAAANEAVAVHAHAAKLGLDRERTVRNDVIALYLTRGNRAAAGELFYGFPDVVS
jgi:1-aminocyclopropane-1-carboxylate deaminase/D-cysteine desulfhydrase-like pyridoxal-dependent ACC family enzyme